MENNNEQEEKKYYITNIFTGKDEEVSYEEWKKYNDIVKEVLTPNFVKHE